MKDREKTKSETEKRKKGTERSDMTEREQERARKERVNSLREYYLKGREQSEERSWVDRTTAAAA